VTPDDDGSSRQTFGQGDPAPLSKGQRVAQVPREDFGFAVPEAPEPAPRARGLDANERRAAGPAAQSAGERARVGIRVAERRCGERSLAGELRGRTDLDVGSALDELGARVEEYLGKHRIGHEQAA
jgi:hypothetical protein